MKIEGTADATGVGYKTEELLFEFCVMFGDLVRRAFEELVLEVLAGVGPPTYPLIDCDA